LAARNKTKRKNLQHVFTCKLFPEVNRKPYAFENVQRTTLLAKALGLAQLVSFLLSYFLSQFVNSLVAIFYGQLNLTSSISSPS